LKEIDTLVQLIKSVAVCIEIDFDPNHKEKYFNILFYPEMSAAIPKLVEDTFKDIMKLLKKRVRVKNGIVLDEFLTRMVLKFLVDLTYDYRRNNTMGDLYKKVRKLLAEIRNIRMSDFLFLIPLVNIKKEVDLVIGNATIANITEDKVLRLASTYNLRSVLGNNEDPQSIVNRLQGDSRHPTLAIVRVNANDFDKAEQISLQAAEQALNVLRFYAWGVRALIKGEEFKNDTRTLVGFDLTHNRFRSMSGFLYHQDPDYPDDIIDSDLVVKLKERKIEAISKLLTKPTEELSPMQGDILSAIYWIGNAEKETAAHDKLIKYAIGLDTLLAQDSREKTETVASRYVTIMGQTWTEDQKIKKYCTIRKYYTTRNQVVHGGLTYIEDAFVQDLRSLVGELIYTLLNHSETYDRVTDLIYRMDPIPENLLKPEKCQDVVM